MKRMLRTKYIFLPVVLLIAFANAKAQKNKTITSKTASTQKFKPPTAKTFWGSHADSASVSVDEALQLLTFPIKIIDDKKINYSLSSYQLLYTKVGIIEDEESGKITPSSTTVADLFKTTPLPDIWIKAVSQQLKAGDELYLFDVVAKDTQGHLFFASPLKIKIIK